MSVVDLFQGVKKFGPPCHLFPVSRNQRADEFIGCATEMLRAT